MNASSLLPATQRALSHPIGAPGRCAQHTDAAADDRGASGATAGPPPGGDSARDARTGVRVGTPAAPAGADSTDGRVDLYAGFCPRLAAGGGHPSRPAVAGRL